MKRMKVTVFKIVYWLFIALMVYLNFIRIFDNNFWEDECFSIKVFRMNYGEIIQFLASGKDTHPPLFYFLGRTLYLILGDHGYTYHLAGLIPYIILIVFASIVFRKIFNRAVAVLFICMASVLPTPIFFNTFVRMYSLAALLVTLNFYYLYEIINEKRYKLDPWIGYMITAVLTLYTNYFSLIPIAIWTICLLIFAIVTKKYFKQIIWGGTTGIIWVAPWLIVMLNVAKSSKTRMWMLDYPSVTQCLQTVFFDDTYVLWIILSILCAIQLIITYFYKKGTALANSISEHTITAVLDKKEILSWIFGMIGFIGTIAVGEIISITVRPLFLTRYLYPVVPVVWFVFSNLIASVSRTRDYKFLPIFLLLIISLEAIPKYIETCNTEKNEDFNTQKTVNEVNELISNDSYIYTDFGQLEWTILDYYFPDFKHGFINNINDIDTSNSKTIVLFMSHELDDGQKQYINRFYEKCNKISEGYFAAKAITYVRGGFYGQGYYTYIYLLENGENL